MTHHVPDEQYGKLKRRLDEVARRVDEGTIPLEPTMLQLQRILEGKDTPGYQLTVAAGLDRWSHMPPLGWGRSRRKV